MPELILGAAILGLLLLAISRLFKGGRQERTRQGTPRLQSKHGVPSVLPSYPSVLLPGSGRYSSDVVGESNYQEAFQRVCGEPTYEGVDEFVVASLLREPENPYDRNAISVWVDGMRVGYLSKQKALKFRDLVDGIHKQDQVPTCNANIRGGWENSEGRQGLYGIWLDLPSPDGVVREAPPSFENQVLAAWRNRDIDQTTALFAVPVSHFTLDRHYLLQGIVEEAFDARAIDLRMARLCEELAWIYIREFPRYARSLKASDKLLGGTGSLPVVPTFRRLATLLTEKGDYSKAIEVCEIGISLGVDDGTKGGLAKRVDRIRNKQKKE